VAAQVHIEFLESLAGLHNLLDLLTREVVDKIHLRWHDFLPDIDRVHRKAKRVVDQEDRTSKLEETELIEAEIEVTLRLVLRLSCGLLALFLTSLVFFF